jgi:E3 ubiquitin-protein ligase MARCH6
MIFVLDLAIGLGVWMPFIIGKCAALLSVRIALSFSSCLLNVFVFFQLDPPRALQLMHLPIRLIRYVTDPIVDLVIYYLGVLLGYPLEVLTNVLTSVLLLLGLKDLLLPGAAPPMDNAAAPDAGAATGGWLNKVEEVISDPAGTFNLVVERIAAFTEKYVKPIEAAPVLMEAESSYSNSTLPPQVTDLVHALEPQFALLGSKMREGAVQAKEGYVSLATGHGTREQVFAVFMGYLVFCIGLFVYLNVLTGPPEKNRRRRGGDGEEEPGQDGEGGRRVLRRLVKQQVLVVKVRFSPFSQSGTIDAD